jgi:hypothetical protein
MRRVWFTSLYVLFLAAHSPLRAQWQVSGDVGASRLRQTDIPIANALAFGGAADWLGERAAFRSSALAARTSSDRWTLQGLAAASLLDARSGLVRWELDGLASAFSATNDNSTLSAELMPRLHVGSADAGAAVGAGGGALFHNGSAKRLLHAQLDGWRTAEADQFLGEISIVSTSLARPSYVPGEQIGYDRLRYADALAGWRRDARGVSLGALGGIRADMQAGRRVDAWASIDATIWMASHTAIVVGAGRTLEDVVRGVPRTRFASVALRFTPQVHSALRRRVGMTGPQLMVERTSDATVRLEVRGAVGSQVEIMSDFTNWKPIALEHTGSVWRGDRIVAPGLHRIALRIDGGEWIVPSNVQRATDDLGGVVGLITVP